MTKRSESILDIRDRLKPVLHIPGQTTIQEQLEAVSPGDTVEEISASPKIAGLAQPQNLQRNADFSDHAFAVESEKTGKLMLAVPVTEAREAAMQNEYMGYLLSLSGRLVEAEKANANGAFWSQGDLEFGLPSVALGPLNWLHQERKVVGVLTGANYVDRDFARDEDVNPHIRADARMWKWLYPSESREVERAADNKQLWYSMECVSRQVQCVGDNGCGHIVDYRERASANACVHMRERSAHRRLVNPIFQGAAIIVPPVRPGWASADLEVTRQAAALVETNELSLGLSTSDAERMVAQVLAYANEG